MAVNFTYLFWVNPGRQLSPAQLLTPPQWDREENRKGKSVKTYELS